VRIAAMEAIAALRIDRGVTTLTVALNDPEADIASQAALSLGSFDTPASREALAAALGVANAQVRRAAIESLGRLRDNTAVEAIGGLAAAASDDLTSRAAIVALGRIGTAESTAALITLLADRDCRADASRALAAATGVALATLIEGLRHPDAGIRCSIIEILGRVKRADMSRAVSEALGDDTPAVRNAAAQALSRRDLRDVDQAIASAARTDQSVAVRNAATSVTQRQ
jgi:HEAT repeat protein